jgi:glyoxylase-like metal-dependent hydrolase (beta-lactamase superfamily II)
LSGRGWWLSRKLRVAAAAAALLAPAIDAAALETVASDAGARMQRLADNAYVILHDDATDEWPHGNTGVIVGRTGVFVIDSCYLPSRARADIALIRKLTPLPVRFLMTTHWHFDHNNGAVAYRDAFPGVTLIAERNTARWIELNQEYWKALSTVPGSSRRESLAKLESGPAPDAGVIARRKAELAELATLEVVPPTQLFDGRLSLDFEGTPIEIENRGPANSPDDSTIWLPREQILFAGDVLVQAPLPYVGASWPVHWARVAHELASLPAALIVPGHGPVMTDHAYTRAIAELLDATLARVEALVRKGRSLAQVQDELNLDDVRARVPEWNGPGVSEDDWTYTRRALAERAFVGLRGQGGR